MADEQAAPEESLDWFPSSSSLSKKAEEPVSPPGGRSSAAERRVWAQRVLTPPEQEVLVHQSVSAR